MLLWRRTAILALIAMLSWTVPAAPADARLMTYTLSFTASGVADGKPFTNRPMTLITVGDMAGSITGSLTSVTKLITAAAYVAGLGFSISAIAKFKQYKDDPTQVGLGPVSQIIMIEALSLRGYTFDETIPPTRVPVDADFPTRWQVIAPDGRRTTLVIRSIRGGKGTFTARRAN